MELRNENELKMLREESNRTLKKIIEWVAQDNARRHVYAIVLYGLDDMSDGVVQYAIQINKEQLPMFMRVNRGIIRNFIKCFEANVEDEELNRQDVEL